MAKTLPVISLRSPPADKQRHSELCHLHCCQYEESEKGKCLMQKAWPQLRSVSTNVNCASFFHSGFIRVEYLQFGFWECYKLHSSRVWLPPFRYKKGKFLLMASEISRACTKVQFKTGDCHNSVNKAVVKTKSSDDNLLPVTMR